MRVTNALAIAGAFGLLARPLRPPRPRSRSRSLGSSFRLWSSPAPRWAAVSTATTMFPPGVQRVAPEASAAVGARGGERPHLRLSIVVSIAGSSAPRDPQSRTPRRRVRHAPPARVPRRRPGRPPGASGPPRRALGPAARRSSRTPGGVRLPLDASEALLQITITALAINFLSTVAFVELGLYVTDTLGVSNAILYGAMVTGSSIGVALGSLADGSAPVRAVRRSGPRPRHRLARE